MTGWVGKESTGRRLARWLPVPAALALFALIGMAISTEDRNEFQTRSNELAARPENSPADASATTVGAGGATGEPSTVPTTVAPSGASSSSSSSAPPEPEGASGGAAVSFEITTNANGRLGVELGPGGPLARPVSADGNLGPPVELDGPPATPATAPGATTPDPASNLDGTAAPDPGGDGAGDDPSTGETTATTTATTTAATGGTGAPGAGAPGGDAGDGTAVGLRLGPDGRLEPVGQDEITAGDLVVTPTPTGDGLDVLLAGGTRVEIQPGSRPDQSPIDVTEVSPDGTRRQRTADDDGRIDLGDGLTIQVPTPDEDGETDPDPLLETVTSGPWRWVALALALVVAGAVLAQLYRRRRPPADLEPFGPAWAGSTALPAHRFEELLNLLSADPDPARAIRLAFSAAERGLGHLPRRQSTETPFEWYRRVTADQPHLAEPLAGLCGCFANARFANAPVTTRDRDLAVAELRRLHRLAANGPGPPDPAQPPAEVGAGV